MGKVAREAAEKEINSWLDYKKVSASKRESYKDQIDLLIDAMIEGSLQLNEDTKVLTQVLSEPLGKDGAVKSLDYKPRLKVSSVHNHMKGVKATDADGRVLAHVCALTSTVSELIKDMYTEDYSVSQAIALFFL